MNCPRSQNGCEQGPPPNSTTKEVLVRWKYLITGLATLVALLIVVAIITVEVKRKQVRIDEGANGTSNDESSIDRVKYVLDELSSNIDSSVDPCDDFYEYACGSFPKKYPILPGRTEVNYQTLYGDQVYLKVTDQLQGDKLKSKDAIKSLKYLKCVWDSCVTDESDTEQQLKKLSEYFKELDQLDSWQEKFAKVTRDGFNVLFTVKLGGVHGEHTQVIIGSPQLETGKMYSKKDVTRLSEFYFDLAHLEEDPIRTTTIELLKFETTLASKSKAAHEKSKGSLHSAMSVEELNKLTEMEWDQLLGQIIEKMEFTTSSRILVGDVDFIQNFYYRLVNHQKDTFYSDYIKLKVLQQSCFYLGNECRNLQYKFFQGLESILLPKFENKEEFIKKTCFDFLKNNLEDLMFKLWDLPEGPASKEIQNENLILFKYLALVFNRRVNWMDDETWDRTNRFVKDEKVYVHPYTKSKPELEAKYSVAPFVDSSDEIELFDHFKSIIGFFRVRQLAVDEIRKDESWPISLFSTVPFVSQEKQLTFIPNYFLQGPFASPDLPGPVQSGFFGSMLAHEMTHTLDAVANHNSELSGSLLWSKWTKDNFNKTFQCLADVFSDQEIEVYMNGKLTVVQIDGNSSLNENLADLFGLNEAFKALNYAGIMNDKISISPQIPEEEMADNRMFFLSYANVHCSNQMKRIASSKSTIEPPPKFLLNSLLAQTDYFALTFNCRTGSKMNPLKKCPFKLTPLQLE